MAEKNQPQDNAPALSDAERAELEELRAFRASQAAAVPAAPVEDMDETVEGGRYRVGDQWVNANGEPLKDQK